ncbi:hypothetical protein O0881_27755 [Janthinobacterium sp. SUN100]|nr:hypothetical protein [Janthinobacterium sp. SUN100]MDN2705798.1 hypothetical protein [Janthinobacterium sp. SUN100]
MDLAACGHSIEARLRSGFFFVRTWRKHTAARAEQAGEATNTIYFKKFP